MAQPKISVSHLAKLANLPLKKKEEKLIGSQIGKIINSFAVLDNISGIGKLPPTFQTSQNKNIFRVDKTQASLKREKILGENIFFTTKVILKK